MPTAIDLLQSVFRFGHQCDKKEEICEGDTGAWFQPCANSTGNQRWVIGERKSQSPWESQQVRGGKERFRQNIKKRWRHQEVVLKGLLRAAMSQAELAHLKQGTKVVEELSPHWCPVKGRKEEKNEMLLFSFKHKNYFLPQPWLNTKTDLLIKAVEFLPLEIF